MAKLDQVKEFIGFLKAVFITSIVLISSLIAYLYSKELSDNYVVLFAIIVDTILKEINLLKDL